MTKLTMLINTLSQPKNFDKFIAAQASTCGQCNIGCVLGR